MTNDKATVYVVDDDLAILSAMSRLLRTAGFQPRTFSSASIFLSNYDRSAPGCILLDLAMPTMDGLTLQQALKAAGNTLPIIFLTGHADVPATVKALKQGAVDFLTKPVERTVLVEAVRNALEQDRSARQSREALAEIRQRLATLTPREYEVMGYVIAGKLNKQTAAEIGAAEKTVKIHRARVMEKMQVESVAQLVRMADQAGIAPDILSFSVSVAERPARAISSRWAQSLRQ